MRVKDLKSNTEADLKGKKLRTTNGVIGYFFSESRSVAFFNPVPDDTAVRERLYPQVFEKREDMLEWEIVDEKVKVNCDVLTSLKYIINPVRGV